MHIEPSHRTYPVSGIPGLRELNGYIKSRTDTTVLLLLATNHSHRISIRWNILRIQTVYTHGDWEKVKGFPVVPQAQINHTAYRGVDYNVRCAEASETHGTFCYRGRTYKK